VGGGAVHHREGKVRVERGWSGFILKAGEGIGCNVCEGSCHSPLLQIEPWGAMA
jgi:hypothetical protein